MQSYGIFSRIHIGSLIDVDIDQAACTSLPEDEHLVV